MDLSRAERSVLSLVEHSPSTSDRSSARGHGGAFVATHVGSRIHAGTSRAPCSTRQTSIFVSPST